MEFVLARARLHRQSPLLPDHEKAHLERPPEDKPRSRPAGWPAAHRPLAIWKVLKRHSLSRWPKTPGSETVRQKWPESGAQLAQVGIGAGAPLDPIAEQDRDPAEVRIPAAAIHLAEGSPERAIELLAPVAERSVESLIPTWAAIHALLFDTSTAP